jgi:hypothetical protein
LRTRQIEDVIPNGVHCVDNISIIIDSKKQMIHQIPYKCPFLNKEFDQCRYLTVEIKKLGKVCEINDDTLIDIEDDNIKDS